MRTGTCGHSGSEFTWYGYRIFLTSPETTELTLNWGSGSWAYSVFLLWVKLPPIIKEVVAPVSIVIGGYAHWMARANKLSKGCGIAMYYFDMAIAPFYIRSQGY